MTTENLPIVGPPIAKPLAPGQSPTPLAKPLAPPIQLPTISLHPSQNVQLEALKPFDRGDADASTFESLPLPAEMRADKAFRRVFDVVPKPDPKRKKFKAGHYAESDEEKREILADKFHLDMWRLSDLCASIPSEDARARLIGLGLKYDLTAQIIFDMVCLWHLYQHCAKEWKSASADVIETIPVFTLSRKIYETTIKQQHEIIPDMDDLRASIESAWRASRREKELQKLSWEGMTFEPRQLLRIALGIPVAKLLQLGMKDPTYVLILKSDDGPCIEIGSVKQLFSQSHVQQAIFTKIGHAVPNMTSKKWGQVRNALGQIREVDMSYGDAPNLRSILVRHIRTGLKRDKREAFAQDGAFIHENVLYIRGNVFENIDGRYDQLRGLGFKLSREKLQLPGVANPVGRAYWRAPIDSPKLKAIIDDAFEPENE